MLAEATTVVYAILASLVYSLIFYVKKAVRKKDPPEFDYAKLGATLVVGLVIGIVFYIGGVPIATEAVETQLIAYAGVVALVESILKLIYRGLKRVA